MEVCCRSQSGVRRAGTWRPAMKVGWGQCDVVHELVRDVKGGATLTSHRSSCGVRNLVHLFGR